MAHRVEHDMLGEREVPDDAYYGIHAVRAVENFPISGRPVSSVPAFVRAIAQVKKAAATANRDLGVLEPRIADAICWACDQVLDEGRCLDQFPVDLFQGGAGTSVNMNANEVVANLALERLGEPRGRYDVVSPHDHVNRSQSTNDAYPTSLRLAVDALLGELVAELDLLDDALLDRGEEFADVLKMGRTQLQDAVPMTLGQEFTAFGGTLGEELRHLQHARDLMLEVNLGATAIGTGVNAPDEYPEVAVAALSRITGRPCVLSPNLIEATSDAGAYVMAHAACKRLATKLSKVCNDLRLLSSGPRAGLNEINLPQMQAGSSIMPAKVNPVIPEMVNQVCFKVIGNDVCVSMAAEAGQLQLNPMEPVIAQCLFESVTLLARAVATLRDRCIVGITANPDVCEAYVAHSIGIVTYLSPLLGHQLGDEVGKEAAATERSVRDVVVDRGLMSPDEVDRVLAREKLLRQPRVARPT